MARTNVPLTKLTANAGANAAAGTAVDPTNGHVIDTGGLSGQLLILVHNTHAATHVITVKSGVNPPAFRQSLGDLAVTCQASGDAVIGPLESARFMQAGDLINVDMAAGITGVVTAYFFPDTV